MRDVFYAFLNSLNFLFHNYRISSLRVLAYHTVPDPLKFQDQLLLLKKQYIPISIEDLNDHLFKGKQLPKKAVLVTFDDGDPSVYENGFPALKKYSIPAVLFVITGLIDTEELFWCRWVEKVYEKKGFSYFSARKKIRELKNISEGERKAYLSSLEPLKGKQLTKEELKELAGNNIFIGNHTHTHPMINKCTKEEIKNELDASKIRFTQWNLPGFSIFAYPNGNWDPVSEAILEEEGIKMAFLFDHKVNKKTIDPLRISRIKVDSDLDLKEFEVKVSGLHPKLLEYKQKLKFF